MFIFSIMKILLNRKKAKSILEGFYNDNNYCISTQVVQEFCNVVLKKIEPEVPEEQLADFISTFPSEQVRAIDVNTVIAALSVKEQYRYSFWDSLIIASAIDADCSILYTEDMNDNQKIGNIRIINPFV